MNFCKYGATQTIGSGIYYVCSETGYPCKFARWCSTTCEYKPNANLNSCRVRTKKIKESLNSEKSLETTEPVVEKTIEEVVVENVVEESVDEPVEEPVKKSRKRTKKASDE